MQMLNVSEKTPLLETDGKKENKNEKRKQGDNESHKRRNEPDYDGQGEKEKKVHQKTEKKQSDEKNLLQSLLHAEPDWTWLPDGWYDNLSFINSRSYRGWRNCFYRSDADAARIFYIFCKGIRVLKENEISKQGKE